MSDSEQQEQPPQPLFHQRKRANSVQQQLSSELLKKSRPVYQRSNSSNSPSDLTAHAPTVVHFTQSLPSPIPTRPMRNPARLNSTDPSAPSSPPRVQPTGRLEDITPWELFEPPPTPPPPEERKVLASPPSKSRLLTSGASHGLSISSLVKRRKSNGTKIFKPRPSHSHAPPPHNLSVTTTTPVSRSHDSPSSPTSSPETPKKPLPFAEPFHVPAAAPPPSSTFVPSKPPPPPSNPALSTADRKILEELKRTIIARESHFTLKGTGPHKQRHHPFSKEEVPYPRSYERIALDLDVWETLWCRQLCRSWTWHVFEKPPSRVLDIGCGTGTWILECAREWRSCIFVGLDIVPLQPDLTQVGSPELASRVTWIHNNFLEGLPFQEEEFDFVHVKRIALGVPEDKWDFLFEEITRVLKPGGAFELLDEDLFFPGEDSEDEEEDECEEGDDVSFHSSVIAKTSSSHPELPSAGSSNLSLTKISTPPITASPLPIPGHELGDLTEDEEYDAEATERLEIIHNAIPQQYHPPDLPQVSSTPRADLVIQTSLPPVHSSPPSAQSHTVTTDSSRISSKHRLPPRPATSPPRSASVMSSKLDDATLALLIGSGGFAVGGIAAVSAEPLPFLTKARPTVKSSQSTSVHDILSPASIVSGDSSIPPPISISAPTVDDSKSGGRHVEKPVANPRDHRLLRFIYKEMNAARFVNLTPLSLLSNSLGLHFKDVRTHPPLQCTFPPKSLSAPPTNYALVPEDEDDARDAIMPSIPTSTEVSEDGRWVYAKGIAHGRSPYVTIDESRAFALSRNSISPKTPAPPGGPSGGEGGGKTSRPISMQPLSKKNIHLPNPELNFDLQTLNLHLSLRVAEIVACAEAMWEYVTNVQEEHVKRPKSRPGSVLLDARPRKNSKRDEMNKALLELTRGDFILLVRNFELDMRDHTMLGSALQSRFNWTCPLYASSADREAFETAIQEWEDYDARKHTISRLSHESESHSHGMGRHAHSNSTSLTAAIVGDAVSASRTSTSSKKPPRKRREVDHLRRSRAMKVFVAWKSS